MAPSWLELRGQLVIKQPPRLTFRYDKGLDHAARVDEILSEISYASPEDEES